MQQEMHNDIRDVFNAPTRSDAEILLKKLIGKHGKTAPDLSSCLENELPEGVTAFNVEPDTLNARRRLQTTKMVEFQNKELKKNVMQPPFCVSVRIDIFAPIRKIFRFFIHLRCEITDMQIRPEHICASSFVHECIHIGKRPFSPPLPI